jgi:hypothetical protein
MAHGYAGVMGHGITRFADWLHFIISLLCHDIGYVRGICTGDGNGSYVINLAGEKTSLPKGATDAAMTAAAR